MGLAQVKSSICNRNYCHCYYLGNKGNCSFSFRQQGDGGTVFGNEECRRDKVWQGERMGDFSWLLGLCLPPLPSTEDPEILRPSNPKVFNLRFYILVDLRECPIP